VWPEAIWSRNHLEFQAGAMSKMEHICRAGQGTHAPGLQASPQLGPAPGGLPDPAILEAPIDQKH
jgi:hypothetical protein